MAIMTRRLVRTSVQLGAIAISVFFFLLFLDNRFRVLPQSIHNHLPAHHPGRVVTDITIKKCSTINLFSKCKLDGSKWTRIEKDLLLRKSWSGEAYMHIKLKQEEELGNEDKVILDVKVSKVDPSIGNKNKASQKWEQRPGGIWVLRSNKRHDSDSKSALTAVDVVFGSDAVEPRPGWSLIDTPLIIDGMESGLEALLSVHHGPVRRQEPPVPRIRKDGRFKIMQVADLHLSTGLGRCRDAEPQGLNDGKCDADPRTLEFVGRLLDHEEPDLVVLTGDQVNGDTSPDAQTAVFKFAQLFIQRHVPYAVIFGNHDDEGPMHRGVMMSLIERLPYSLSKRGPSTVDGVGNYFVEVLAPGTSHHSAMTLYLLDTHGYSPDEKKYKGYDWIKDNQIRWFRDTSRELKKKHHEYSKIHLEMAFIHIPLPEYGREDNDPIIGNWTEPITAPKYNSHFRDALVEEGVHIVTCGHDHVNDYCALSRGDQSKKAELWMCYGGGSGFGGYGGYGGYHRRIRFFDVDTNSARISTYKRLEYGDIKKRIDEQVLVEGGKPVA